MLGGRSLPHALTMLVPEAWTDPTLGCRRRRAFYEYHAALVEPWDGPAAIVAQRRPAASARTLDRNGLRPARCVRTPRRPRRDLASEVGVVDVDRADVVEKGRLEPGADARRRHRARAAIVDDAELKRDARAAGGPYRRWLDGATSSSSTDSATADAPAPIDRATALARLQRAFGYTDEELELIVAPMAQRRQGAGRLDGRRHAARGAVASAPRLLHDVLPPAVRAGDEPADRSASARRS